MALKEKKITEAGISAHGVASAPDRLTGTAAENKKVFDNLVRAVVAEAVNGIVDELTGENGAEQIGMKPVEGIEGQTVQEGFGALLGKLQRWEKEITGSVVNVPVDEVPTEGSVGVPSSGGTWAALQGLAPSGYGIGEEVPEEAASADEAVKSGWYIVPDPDNAEKKMLLFTESMDENSKKQTAHRFAGGSMKRSMTDGAWGAWVGFDRVGDVVFSSRNMEVETEGQYIALDGRTVDVETYPVVAKNAANERVPEPVTSVEGAEMTKSKSIYNHSALLDGALFWVTNRGYLRTLQPDGTTKLLFTSAVYSPKACNGQILAIKSGNVYVFDSAGNEIRTKNTGDSGSLTNIFVDENVSIASSNSAFYRSDDNFQTFVTAAGANGHGLAIPETSLHKPIQKHGDSYYAVNQGTVYRSADKGVSWVAAFTITTELGDIAYKSGNTTCYHKHFIHNGYLYYCCGVAGYGLTILKVDLETGSCEGHTSALRSSASVKNDEYLCGAIYNNTAYCAIAGKPFKIDLETMQAEAWEPYPGVTVCSSKNDVFATGSLLFIETDTIKVPDYHKEDGTGEQTVCIVYDMETGKSAALYNALGWDQNSMTLVGDEVWFVTGAYSDSKHSGTGLHKINLKQRVLPEIDFGYIKAMEG